MSQASQQQSVQNSGVSNANNVPANGVSLPAVPVFQFVDPAKEDRLTPMMQGKFGAFATAMGPENLAAQLEPDKLKRNALTQETIKKVEVLKQFLDSVKKKLGDNVMWEGIAEAFRTQPLTMGNLTPLLTGGDIELHIKEFVQRITHGKNKDKGNITIKKEYNAKDIVGPEIDEAVALYGPGCSFFGSVYLKQYEMNLKQDDPAVPPKMQKEMTDYFEFTVQCAHNSFVIKDENHPSDPTFVKTSAEAAAAMRNHINKNYAALKLKNEKPEMQMIMEFNVPTEDMAKMMAALNIDPAQ